MLFVKKDIKKLLSVMIPILVAQVSTAGVTFINTTMAGHAGADDLAGVSVGAGLFYPLLASIIGLLMAGTPLMAQLIGRKERESLPFIVRSGMVIGLSVWALFTAAYFFFIDDLLASLALEAAVEHIARYYLMTMIGVVFFLALMIPLRCLTDTAGSTSISMKLFLMAPVINGIFNYLFIYGHGGMPALGGIGAGLATMMTYGFLLGLFLLVVMKSKDLGGRQIFSSLALRSKDLREYLVVGVPSGLSIFMEMSLFSLIIVFLSRYGTDALAAYQIADNFASLVYMLPVSCSMALTILIATAVGAGDMTLARRYKKAGFVVAMGGAMMTASFTVLFRNSIGSVYTDDAAVALIAGQFLIYSAGWQLFDAISTPIQGILRGLKDTRISFVLMVLAYWGGCFPMSLFLDSHTALGADSFWLGLDFGVGCSAFLMILRLLYVERKLDGRPMPSLSWFLSLIPGRKTAPAAVYAISLQRNIKKAEELLDLWTAMEEKLSMLMQEIKESEVDIYEALGRILPIRLSLLTDLHLSIIGHASRAYIP
ncbi:MATE family efflux transporter [Dialister succinatiphilus]|uniref:Probable multidrug resistance protein NorM n=1 Tax=Dialister succinatiphilus YIT 11850 TaxID=742743 RepID=H1CXX0_9FIRM|nr:MATE family efflux transporter [Dialister succinatiphilus]EHO63848.1 MATE efflux family protein [Dialister succinatiphilus YIT 11850]